MWAGLHGPGEKTIEKAVSRTLDCARASGEWKERGPGQRRLQATLQQRGAGCQPLPWGQGGGAARTEGGVREVERGLEGPDGFPELQLPCRYPDSHPGEV